MILFDEKMEGPIDSDVYDESPSTAVEKETTPPRPSQDNSNPRSNSASRATGLLQQYLALYNTQPACRRKSPRSSPPAQNAMQLTLGPPADSTDPPPYHFDEQDQPTYPPDQLDTSQALLAPLPPPRHPSISRSFSTPRLPPRTPRPTNRTTSLPIRTPISPTQRLSTATPFTHMGNRNLRILREQSPITGSYVINTDIPEPFPEHQGGFGCGLHLETKKGDIDVSVSTVGQHPTRQCDIVALSHRGNVKLSFNDRESDPSTYLAIQASSLGAGNAYIHLPPHFTGPIRITTPPPSKISSTTLISISHLINPSLSQISQDATTHRMVTEYFYGDSITTAQFFSNPDEVWRGDSMEVEAVNGRVFIYAHGEEMPIGWLSALKRQVGRWFGY